MNTIRHRYETLRRGALGDVIPSESRSGLVILLRSGLTRWARSLTNQFTKQCESTKDRIQNPQLNSELVSMLAGLILSDKREKYHE